MEITMNRLAFGFALIAGPAFADTEGYGHMMGWGGGGLGMLFGPVLWLIVLGLVVAGVIRLVQRAGPGTGTGEASGARAELDMRFAKGEIDADEYASRRKLLGGA
ncbi:SHOCT domain-containing protein [Limimaricola sp.]|uniref:SHOCT domain-containing protein n=1 Tax=Limimaricola sp. TaxID=2211665 RepID=UPI0040594A38